MGALQNGSLAYDSFSRLALNDNRLDPRYLDDALWIAFRAGWVSASAKASAASTSAV